MTNDNKEVMVVNTERSALVAMEFNEQQVDLIKKTVAKGTTNDELALFLYTCKKTGLDPLIKQIYAVKRAGTMAIQTGIDGYRLIAERTGKYAPGKEPKFTEVNGKLVSATAYVMKKVDGTWHEVAATARYEEYANHTNPIWKKMPFAMLAKCAESLVLRKSFPAEMAGVMTKEEMDQADVQVSNHNHTEPAKIVVAEQVDDIKAEQEAREKAEIARKIAEQKAALAKVGIEAKKVEVVIPTDAPKHTETGLKCVIGEIVNLYPPKSPKGPTNVKVMGSSEYYSTFDKATAELLEQYKADGKTVELHYEVKINGKYSNNLIKVINLVDTVMPEPMDQEPPMDEAPF